MSKKINTILVPVDFTENSINALETSIDIAKKNHAKILVLYVLDISSSLMTDMEISFEGDFSINSLEDRCENLLRKLKKSIEDNYQFTIEVMVKKGLIASSVVSVAQEEKSDLIVIGTHGTGLRTSFLGSNAYGIIKQATCSILAIPREKKHFVFTKMFFPEQKLQDELGKLNFLKKIVHKKDTVIEIPGLIENDSKINIKILNETIHFLEEKLMEEFDLPNKFQSILTIINNTLDNIKIKLITIPDTIDNIMEELPVSSSQKQIIDYSKIPVLSISHY